MLTAILLALHPVPVAARPSPAARHFLRTPCRKEQAVNKTQVRKALGLSDIA